MKIKKIKYIFFIYFFLSVLSLVQPLNAREAVFKISDQQIIARAGESAEIVIISSVTPPYHLYAPGNKTGIPLSFSITDNSIESQKIHYASPAVKKYAGIEEPLFLYEDIFYSTLEIKLSAGTSPGILKLPIKINYQACTDTSCTPPASDTIEAFIEVTSPAITNDRNSAETIGNINSISLNNETPSIKNQKNQTDTNKKKDAGSFATFYEKSIFLAIVMAFIWGLISSLTPCVYPMIPITVAFFGSQAGEGSKKKTFALALVFVTGIALSFAASGVIVTFIGMDAGAIMANAWFTSFIIFLLLFFAGALFELYEIRMPDAVMSKMGRSEQGFFGAFSMGLTMGLVAAPCVGPFAGSLLIFVSTINSAVTGFILLFSYGMGLGMLFLAVATGAKFLPKSGIWMVRLKNFFGLLIMWITLYFMQLIAPLYLMYSAASIYAIITSSVLGTFLPLDNDAALSRHFARNAGAVSLAIAVIFAAAGLLESGVLKIPPAVLPFNSNAFTEPENSIWIKDYDAGMKTARAENKPIIIDFYADWCIPCKQIDSQIFKHPDFINETKRFVKIKLDCTHPSSKGVSIKKQKYNSPYMPFIVFYNSAGIKTDDEIHGYTSLKELLTILKKIN